MLQRLTAPVAIDRYVFKRIFELADLILLRRVFWCMDIKLQEELTRLIDVEGIGDEIYEFVADIFPICRSITGNGVRQTLQKIRKHIALNVREVATGTKAFDWTIPLEWNIRDAYIKDLSGQKIVDFAESNLHVMSYSTPIRRRLSLAELKQHVYSLPELPDVIPYRTSYYSRNWAFCMTYRQLEFPLR